jgi:hypothetical protein
MNYELLAKLRDAGFPQKEGSLDRMAEDAPGDIPPYRWAYYPTLEELLEACGDKFYNLKKSFGGNHWDAASLMPVTATDEQIIALGPTPIEAVARLWLALNPKKA